MQRQPTSCEDSAQGHAGCDADKIAIAAYKNRGSPRSVRKLSASGQHLLWLNLESRGLRYQREPTLQQAVIYKSTRAEGTSTCQQD